ncbi:MAG: ATP-binding cassette domain-containing protein [Gemella sp.]|nr:ATP-binding cassette domain-containing protein [Gemella sp.]
MTALLSLKAIHKTFQKKSVNENHVLKGLSLDINKGDFITVIGGNGAGKSTLMNCIAGNLTIDEGDILLEGKSVKTSSVKERAKDISRVFQDPKMGTAERLTIEENMAVAQKRGKKLGLSWGVKDADRAIFKESLEELGMGLENRLNVDAQFLSGGQRQALALVMATMNKPKLLLLDEHTAALDPKISNQVMELTEKLVRKHDLTSLMITHNMEHAIKYGNRLVMLDKGKIVVDVSGEEKESLTVTKLIELFKKNTGDGSLNDSQILG